MMFIQNQKEQKENKKSKWIKEKKRKSKRRALLVQIEMKKEMKMGVVALPF